MRWNWFESGLKLLRGLRPGRRASRPIPPTRRWRPQVEGLEDRTLLTGPLANLALDFATYQGGPDQEMFRAAATRPNGNIIIAGGVVVPDNATLQHPNLSWLGAVPPGSPAPVNRLYHTAGTDEAVTRMDVFVSEYNPAGQRLWTTIFGGPSMDRAYDVEVNSQGQVVVTGRAGRYMPGTVGSYGGATYNTNAAFFPNTVAAGFLPAHQGGAEGGLGTQDAFSAILDATGRLTTVTYVGGNGGSIARGSAIGPNDEVYLAMGAHREVGGVVYAETYPTAITNALAGRYRPTPGNGIDTLIVRLSANLQQILGATFIGGTVNGVNLALNSNAARGPAVAVDPSGFVYVATGTMNGNLPANGFQTTFGGDTDAYIVKLTRDLTTAVYQSYLGGSANDIPAGVSAIAADASGNAYVLGSTRTANFSTTTGVAHHDPLNTSTPLPLDTTDPDNFVVKVSPTGQLIHSTLVGGLGSDGCEGIVLDAARNVYASAYAFSVAPTSNAYQQGSSGGGWFRLSADFSQLDYATRMAGASLRAIAVDSNGNVVVTGTASNSQFVAQSAAGVPPPAQTTYGGGITDGVIARFRLSPPSTVQFGYTTYNGLENGGSRTITVFRTGIASGPVTVNYATSNGTATAGSDYTAVSGTFTWAAGDQSNRYITIPLRDDAVYEGMETVNVALIAPTGPAQLGPISSAVLRIYDNDSPTQAPLNVTLLPDTGFAVDFFGRKYYTARQGLSGNTSASPVVIGAPVYMGTNSAVAGAPWTFRNMPLVPPFPAVPPTVDTGSRQLNTQLRHKFAVQLTGDQTPRSVTVFVNVNQPAGGSASYVIRTRDPVTGAVLSSQTLTVTKAGQSLYQATVVFTGKISFEMEALTNLAGATFGLGAVMVNG